MQTQLIAMKIEAVRKRAMWAVHADGIFDVVLGIPLLLMGINITFRVADFDILPIVLFPLIVPLMFGLKAMITQPRIGFVEVKPALSIKKQLWLLTGLMLLGIGGFIAIGFAPDAREMFKQLFPTVLQLGLAAYLITIGLHYEVRRWLVLAGILVLSAVVMLLIPTGEVRKEGIALLIMGSYLLVVGMATLVHFVRSHPVHRDEEPA